MTSDTFSSKKISSVYVRGNLATKTAIPAEALKPGQPMRIASDGKMYKTKFSDGVFSGIVENKSGHDGDSAYATDGSDGLVPYYPKGQDTVVKAYVESASPVAACNEGYPAILATSDGLLRPFPYADGTEGTDSLSVSAGTFDEYDAGDLSDNRLLNINLGG